MGKDVRVFSVFALGLVLVLGGCSAASKASNASTKGTVKLGSATTTVKVSGASGTGTGVSGSTGTSKGKVAASLPTVTLPSTTLKAGAGPLATLKPATTVRAASTLPAVTVPAGAAPAKPEDRNCKDFANWAEAKQFFDTYYPYYGDVAHLDGDGDGIPCESLAGSPK